MTLEPDTPPQQSRRGPSPRLLIILAIVVSALFIIAAILRLVALFRPPATDPREAQEALTQFALEQRLEEEVRQYVLADDPLIDPTESMMVTCSRTSGDEYSCFVQSSGSVPSSDILTIRVFGDGTWKVLSP